MKMRIKQLMSVAVGILLFTSQSLASSPEAIDFKKFISQTFEKNLGSLDNGNNLAPFLKAFSQNLVWVDVVISTNGEVSENVYDKSGLRKAVNLSANTPSLYVKWDIINYGAFKVRENTITGTFETAVSIYAGDTVIATGKNIVQIIAKPIDDSYIITYLNILQTADAIYKGKCFVNVRKDVEGDYTVNTFVPNGTKYKNIQCDVNFSGDKKNQLVTLNGGENKYYWNPAQKSITAQKMNSPKLASASNPETAILEIVKIQQKDNCTRLILSRKK